MFREDYLEVEAYFSRNQRLIKASNSKLAAHEYLRKELSSPCIVCPSAQDHFQSEIDPCISVQNLKESIPGN